jgi:hypothetical protein
MEKGRIKDAEKVIKEAIEIAGGEATDFILVDPSIHASNNHNHYGGYGNGVRETPLAEIEAATDDDDDLTTIDFENNNHHTKDGLTSGDRDGNNSNENREERQRDALSIHNSSQTSNNNNNNNNIVTAATTTSFVDMVRMHYKMYADLLQPQHVGYSYILWWAWFRYDTPPLLFTPISSYPEISLPSLFVLSFSSV